YSASGAFLTMRTLVVLLLFGAALTGCAIPLSAYDQASIDRTTEISRSILALYQEMMMIDPDERADAVRGSLRDAHGDIETQIRLHLLREQARALNDEGALVAENLLASWQAFSMNHFSGEETALTDATLEIERQILERHLRSAFVAEESKKLARGGTQTNQTPE